MRSVLIELCRMSILKADDIPGELNHRALHSQADAEERNALLASVTNRLQLAINASFAKATGNENSIVALQQSFSAFRFDVFALNASDANLCVVVNSGVIQRFIDRLVRIFVLGIFAHDSDTDFVLWIAKPMEYLVDWIQIRRCGC